MFKLPWENLEILAEKSEKRITNLESESREVLNKIIDHEQDYKSLEKKYHETNNKIDAIQECKFESELETISILRRLGTVESKLTEIELINLQREQQVRSRWHAVVDFIFSIPSLAKKNLKKHHLLISSVLLMTAAAAGVTYLVVYLL